MANIEIRRYYARWDVVNNVGRIDLYDATNVRINSRTYQDPQIFGLLVDLLRNERPIYFLEEGNFLRTGDVDEGEQVGEEET